MTSYRAQVGTVHTLEVEIQPFDLGVQINIFGTTGRRSVPFSEAEWNSLKDLYPDARLVRQSDAHMQIALETIGHSRTNILRSI